MDTSTTQNFYIKQPVINRRNFQTPEEIPFNSDNSVRTRIFEIANLLFTYAIYLAKLGYFIFFSTLGYIISFIYQREKSIYNQIVLITGSAGYLGRSLAIEFAKRNAQLVLLDINEEENEKTNEELKAMGYKRAALFKVDITDEEQLKDTLKRVKTQIGEVNIAVMVAAPAFKGKSILEINYKEDIEKHFKIGYLSQLWIIQELIKPMIKKNSGHFVQISSSSALVDIPFISSYTSFKLAQTKLLETLREELIMNGINGIHTTVSFVGALDGGLADAFSDSFAFNKRIVVTGSFAAKQILSAVLKNKYYLFMPEINRWTTTLKYVLSPVILRAFIYLTVKINPKYLILKNFRN